MKTGNRFVVGGGVRKSSNDCWVQFLFRGMKVSWNEGVVMDGQFCAYTKTTELCTLNGYMLGHVDYISNTYIF